MRVVCVSQTVSIKIHPNKLNSKDKGEILWAFKQKEPKFVYKGKNIRLALNVSIATLC